MKRIAVMIMLVALFAVGASAIQITSPTIGTDQQDRVKNVATTFTVTNNETVALTNIQFVFSAGAENAKYALQVTGPTTINANTAQTYTINGTIPLDHPGVDSDLKEAAVKIGVITVSGSANGAKQAAADVNMQAVNQLRVKKARIECDTKSQSLDDGDRVKNLKPGNDCTLELEIENEFDDSDRNNQKIGDIAFETIDISVDASNGDIDLDDDNDLDDLDANDEDSVTFDIEIDEEADDGTVTLDIRVSGRDENGALHGEAMDVKLEIERLSHDVQLQRIELTPSSVLSCEDTTVKATANVLNQGKRDEDEVAVEITSNDLKLAKKVENIELDRDDSTSVSFDVPVPANTRAGVIRLDVKTFFDTIAQSNAGSVELNVIKCEEDVEAPIVNEEQKEPVKQTTVVVPQTPISGGQAQAAPKKQTSFTDSTAYVALLVVLSVLIALLIVGAVILLQRKKQK